ncbi:MAG: signal peptidase II [Ottowia sp.]|nr:signal peptidase II [Ottowia sp.]
MLPPEKEAPARPRRLLLAWLALAAAVILLDQFSKAAILRHYALGESTVVTSFFNIVRAHNTGAAFSFLAGHDGWQRWFFVALAVVVSGVIVWLLRRHAQNKGFCLALSLILGGAIGNVIDRLVHGYVIDFLDFHWAFLSPVFYGGHYPAFNVADAAITVGAVLLILFEFLRPRS